MIIIVAITAVLIAFLAPAALIVSGVWLLILGEWGGFSTGLMIFMFSERPCKLLLTPGWKLAQTAHQCLQRGNSSEIPCKFLIAAYMALDTILMLTWGIVIFALILIWADFDSLAPYMILAFGLISIPWGFLASEDTFRRHAIPVISLMAASGGAVAAVIFEKNQGGAGLWIFFGVMGISFSIGVINLFLRLDGSETRDRVEARMALVEKKFRLHESVLRKMNSERD